MPADRCARARAGRLRDALPFARCLWRLALEILGTGGRAAGLRLRQHACMHAFLLQVAPERLSFLRKVDAKADHLERVTGARLATAPHRLGRTPCLVS